MNLYNEDCRKILPSIQNCSLILTDPPYDFDKQTKLEYHRMLQNLCTNLIIFCPPENQWMPECDQWLFWIKPISTKNTSKSYSRFVAMIHVWNGVTWNCNRHWSQYTNVFHDLVDDKLHPFAKPISLLERLIRNHTNEGDLVVDPFMGSGTTGMACKRTGRRVIGIELSTEWFEIARDRINAT